VLHSIGINRLTLLLCLALLAVTVAHAEQKDSGNANAAHLLTVDDTVGELLDNPRARAVIERELPILLDNPQIGQARGLSLRALQVFAPTFFTDETFAAVDAALARAGAMSEPGRTPDDAPVNFDPREALALKPVSLWPDGAPGALGDDPLDVPTLTVVAPDGATSYGTAVIVAPGGGYMNLATGHEGRQVADWLAAHGITAFVLTYRLCPRGYRHPTQLQDAQRAIRWVRHHARDYGVDAKRIGMMGFSAGGHLTAMAATLWPAGNPQATDPIDRLSSRPDFTVLAYAPLEGKDSEGWVPCIVDATVVDPAATDQVVPTRKVSSKTPPTFIFHTSTDELVSPKNATAFYVALLAVDVPAELHIFAAGRHGLGLAMTDPALAAWPSLLASWLRGQNLIGGVVVSPVDP